MRLLYAHADRAAFESTREAGDGAARDDAGDELADCVAAFVAVEPGDAAAPDAVAADAADELRSAVDRLGVDRIAVSPCPALVDDPADDGAAATLLDALVAPLSDYEVLRAPVGGVAGEVAWRGHPLAVGSLRTGPGDGSPRPPSDRTVVTPAGERRPIDAAADATRAVAAADRPGSAAAPPGEDRLRDLGFVAGGEGEADADRTWLPRGAFVADTLADYADDLLAEAGAVPVATSGNDGRGAAGRAAASAGDLDGSDLPLRVRERRGASPAATPEMTVVAADAAGARTAFERAATLARDAVAEMGVDAVPVVRHVEGADAVPPEAVAAALGTPVLAETLPLRPGRWSVALDFVVTVDGRAVRTAGVRYDPPRAASADDAGAPSRPAVRCSPVGPLDAAVRALAAGDGPPTWLAPTQVRLVPVDPGRVDRCEAAVSALAEAGVRADVDDREATVGERLALAEREAVPYYAVVGDREADGDALPVTERATGRETAMTVAALAAAVGEATAGHPSRRRPLPARLGDRPLP
ncbi:threonyl-tRNA synthetase editing domain-containing protein [Halostella litorea]|uniref:threonyl-tRNA synthetase editing domain-containing protein n=1 Tax=Halostella litorea TaxID=2528831 RepID=UPI001092B928|nr:threonyl-tRNA synthetase editing domain-containing protein [Halostella litorea]